MSTDTEARRARLHAASEELLEIVEQLAACHDEPDCPAVAIARELVQRVNGVPLPAPQEKE